MKKNSRGAVDPVTLLLIVGAGAYFFGGSFHLPAFLQKKPPVAQLSVAEGELIKARAAQQVAEAALAQARAEEQLRTSRQLDYAQQFANGTTLALARVPAEQQSPEIKLATEMAMRANAGLEAARGKLPPEAQAEIQHLVDQALSAVSAERDAYKTALAQKDAALRAESQAKVKLEERIPVLEASVQTAKAETAVVDAKTQALTTEIKVWAQGKADSDAKAGSLDAYAGHLVRILIGLGILYLFIHFMLPSLAQEFPASRVLTWANKTVKSLTSAHV